MGKNEKFLKFFEKKRVWGREKNFGSDTEIGPWFRFSIPKLGFGRTLLNAAAADAPLNKNNCSEYYLRK